MGQFELCASLECADLSALWPKRCQGTALQGDVQNYNAMPQGPSPALMVVITLFVLVSMTETSFETPFAV